MMGGYEDFEVEPGVHYISFSGNAYTSKMEATKGWHQRAKELCGEYEMISQASAEKKSYHVTEYAVNTSSKPLVDGYVRCANKGG